MTTLIEESITLPIGLFCSSIPKAYCLRNRIKSCHECDNFRQQRKEEAGYTLVQLEQKDKKQMHGDYN